MRPTLRPGDGLLAVPCTRVRRGELRVFRDPTLPTRWLIKRVGDVQGATFEARSDNPGAPGVVDSRQFGAVPAEGSYRVVWTVRAPNGRRESGIPLVSVALLAVVSSCVLTACYRILSRSTHSRVGPQVMRTDRRPEWIRDPMEPLKLLRFTRVDR